MQRSPVFVVDSSVILKWVCREHECSLDQSDALLKDMTIGSCAGYAPFLSLYEVSNALLKSKKVPPKHAERAMRFLHTAPVTFAPESLETAILAYEIAHEHDITYYDAAFLALAKAMDGTLVTDNVKHQTGIPGIDVIPLAQYTTRAR